MTERITGHLREWLDKTTFIPFGSPTRYAITSLADEIDQALEDELAKERARTENEYETLRDGWVRLPLDADGVPINVGDVMHGYGETFTVHHLALRDEGWAVSNGHGRYYSCMESLAHHHAPTVEDVLRELLDAWDERGDVGGIDLSEYAAKLRLAGDGE